MTRRFPNMSAADRDRCEEQEAERYDELFVYWTDRLTKDSFDNSAPSFAEVHRRVCKQMDEEERANRDD